jgi:chloride channel protein, CIC family
MALSNIFLRIRSYLPKDKTLILLVLAGLIGTGGAFATLVFRSAFTGIQHFLGNQGQGVVALAHALPWWGRLVLPMIGGALAGVLLKYVLRWAPHSGADDYLEALSVGEGALSVRQTLIKSAASLCSIDTGASIGREGPMVQLAALVGSVLGQALKVSRERLRLLIACGATAGITAAYNAPIAGTLFVIEIGMGKRLSKATLGPLIVASVMANVVTRKFFGLNSVYQMPHFTMISGWEVFAFAGLGIVCGFAAPVFRWLLDGTRRGFKRFGPGFVTNMALGGLGVGLLSIWQPDVWGNGYSVVNSILHATWTWQALFVILVFKIAATALSAGSGAIGGVFTPTLFVGAVLGGLYGHVLVNVSSLADTNIVGYSIVGMGAFLASVTYAPLMSILMIFEMTLSYEVVLPLMLACVIGHYIAHRWRPDSIYGRKQPAKP